jgi:hypothetical protein
VNLVLGHNFVFTLLRQSHGESNLIECSNLSYYHLICLVISH